MTRITLLLIGIAVLLTAGTLLATAGGRPWQAVAGVIMLSVLPYVAFTAMARWTRGTPLAEMAVLGGLILALFFAVGVYVLALWLDPGPRSSQAVVMVPLAQSIPVALAGAGAAFAKYFEQRSAT
jgi:apolipoprotein N-acyltransferase